MGTKLADLRANKSAPRRPERSATICLKPDLMAEMQHLNDVLAAATPAVELNEDGERKKPRRMGAGDPPAVAEAKARMQEVLDEIAENEGELRLRAKPSDGDWRRFCSEHPPRDRETRDGQYDLEVAAGYCNADDLIGSLGLYAHSWDGEPLAADDWAETLGPNVGLADRKVLANMVVSMYESRVDPVDFRSGWSGILISSNASA